MGTKPRAATSAVIRMARSRRRRVSSTARSRSRPSSSILRRIVETSTRPFSIETPDTATNPTPAEIVNGMSRRVSAAVECVHVDRHDAVA
jgi:hypothetical protein